MAWGVMLEGRDGDADLEGLWNGSLRGGLAHGLDGPLQVGSRLLGGEARLETVAREVKHAGGQAREYPVGTAFDLVNGGGDAIGN